jgi:hypothetical protein
VPVEENSLNMIASFVLVDAAIMNLSRFRTLPFREKTMSCRIILFRGRPRMSAQVS